MSLFEHILTAFLLITSFRLHQTLLWIKSKPYERNLLGYFRVTVSFGGDPNEPLYFESFLDLWDWGYGWMLTNERDEEELRRFAHIEKIEQDGIKCVSWDDYPQNKESREKHIQEWVSRNIKRECRREGLADLSHRQWSGWMEYLFEKSSDNQDGTVTIPAWAVERWRRQLNTPYSELPEQEKESDRKEADRVLSVIREGITQ
jgi:hypothetical protein